VSFQGNRAIADETLRISIATSQSSWFVRTSLVSWMGLGEKRYLNDTELRRDVLRIVALYRQAGFIDAAVDTLVRRTDVDVHIRFLIDEGEPVRVDSIIVRGHEQMMPTYELVDALPLHVGDPFNRLLLLASADTIRLRLANRGHPFAEVYRNFDIDRERRTGRAVLEVDPGPHVVFGEVKVEGLEDVDERVVRRTLSIRPGDEFRQRELYRSQLSLYRTDLFTYASVFPADTAGQAADSAVNVRVRVAEGPLRQIRLGVGYGTIDCFRALASWKVLNFLGGGRSLQLRGQMSKIGTAPPFDFGLQNSLCKALASEDTSRLKLNYNLTTTFQQPYVFTSRARLTATAFAQRYTEYRAYLREAIGGEVGLGYDLAPAVPLTVAYSLSYGSTKADPVTYCTYLNVCRVEDTEIFSQRRWRATLSGVVVRERRNSVIDPTGGTWAAAELRVASPAIGSDSLIRFAKGTVEFSAYRRVTASGVLSVRLKLGTIFSGFACGEEGLTCVPTDERFYSGGASTVRGYAQNELGPKVRVREISTKLQIEGSDTVVVADTTVRTSPTGGNDLVLFNLEYRFPLPGLSRKLSAALFVDAGRVFDRGYESPGPTGLRVTPGIGLRLTSPLGPIRLDIAYNPYPPDAAPLYELSGSELVEIDPVYKPERTFWSPWRLHFSVGQPF
jgi:outer membrane protein assembly complex protein YaeT